MYGRSSRFEGDLTILINDTLPNARVQGPEYSNVYLESRRPILSAGLDSKMFLLSNSSRTMSRPWGSDSSEAYRMVQSTTGGNLGLVLTRR